MDVLRDFRQLPIGLSREFSPELALLIRQVQMHQEWVRNYLEDEEADKLGFVGSVLANASPVNIANDIRLRLGVSPGDQIGCGDIRAALNLWVNGAEDRGVFVCRQGKIEMDEARGFALCDPFAPFIWINSSDALAGQLFTLIHEMAHLWINKSGVSNIYGLETASRDPNMKIEALCNKVAAEVLLERSAFNEIWQATERAAELQDRIQTTARRLNVSEESVARRLLDTGTISSETYSRLRQEYAERWNEYKRQRGGADGGPSYYLMKAINNGRLFSRTVVSAYLNGRLSGCQASHLLGAKIGHFGKIASCAGLPLAV
ncbi:MAG: ImmA/IrrE family metallo-endopeptidase [Pseudomonadota bacterium]